MLLLLRKPIQLLNICNKKNMQVNVNWLTLYEDEDAEDDDCAIREFLLPPMWPPELLLLLFDFFSFRPLLLLLLSLPPWRPLLADDVGTLMPPIPRPDGNAAARSGCANCDIPDA